MSQLIETVKREFFGVREKKCDAMRRNGGGACETLKKLRTQKILEDLKIEAKIKL